MTHPRPSGRRRWPFVVGGLVLIIVVVVVVIAVRTFSTSDVRPDAGPARLSGDRSAWTSAVCADDSQTKPSANFLFAHATDLAYCLTKPTAGAGPTSVIIGEWPDDVTVRADLARSPTIRWFAAGDAEDRTTVFALVSSADRTALEPLTRFGFTISSPS